MSETTNDGGEKRKWRVSRRGFLIGIGATGAALALGVRLGLPAARLKLAEFLDGATQPGSISNDPTLWLEIDADNTVRLHVPKVEMGQGIHTALGQIAAEELEVDWEQMEVVQASTEHGPHDSAGTGGSSSVANSFTPLREAAATMRQMLLVEAARQLSRPESELVAANGTIAPKDDPDAALTYGAIVQNAGAWEVPETPPALKPVSAFKTIGKAHRRVDLPAKITGEAIYGYDKRLPDMLYGAVARPPTIEGTLASARPGDAAEKDGVVQVVLEDDFAGVVARSRRQAYAGVGALEVEWDRGKAWQQDEIDALTAVGEGNGVIVQKEGDPDDPLRQEGVIMAEYRTPLAAHAHLEPQAALVDVQEEGVTAWVSTQSPLLVRDEIAGVLGRDAEEVNVIATYLGGGFGRRLNVEVALEAARLSQASGRPVHVGWNRPEDFRQGYFRPPTHHVLRAALDDGGRITAMEHQQASGDVAFPFFPGIAAAVMGADFGAWRGATIQYGIPHRRTIAWRIKLPIRTGWWRGLGLLANTFAIESFMDELAHTAGVDPLAFRLAHLPDNELGRRYRTVLETAAERAGWGEDLAPGRGLGIACSVDVNTIVAQVAEVSWDEANNRPRVHKVTAAMDAGLIINPDGATAQTQGSIIMGIGSTLLEKITVKDGAVEAGNFDRYPLLTIKEAPDIDVILVDSPLDVPNGIGEPPLGPVAAAVANAVFALTGQRLRQLPLRL